MTCQLLPTEAYLWSLLHAARRADTEPDNHHFCVTHVAGLICYP